MKKQSKKRQKKHVPINIKNSARRWPEIVRTTFFYHGSFRESSEAIAGNYEHRVTANTAARILNQKNTWSVLLLAFLDTGTEQYTKMHACTIKYPVTREQLNMTVDTEQLKFIQDQNMNHLISCGWVIVPDHNTDLIANKKQFIKLFESEGAFNPELINLSCHIRDTQNMHTQEIKKQELAA